MMVNMNPPTYVSFPNEIHSSSSAKALEYSDDEASLSSMEDDSHGEGEELEDKNVSIIFDLSPEKMPLIDEIESRQIEASSTNAVKKFKFDKGGYVKATSLNTPSLQRISPSAIKRADSNKRTLAPVPCSCCKSYVECKQIKKSNLISSSAEEGQSAFSSFLDYICMRSLITEEENSLTNTIRTDADQKTEGQNQNSNFEYTITKSLAEDWLSKKGSGNDMFGSTSWKPRWCQLVLAKVPFYEVEVPLLLVSWHFTMPTPSTIIILDKKIAIGIDALDTSTPEIINECTYNFDIVAGGDKSVLPSSSSTRSFSASTKESRDKWVDKINSAISDFERSRKNNRRARSSLCLPPIIPRTASTKQCDAFDDSELDGLDLVL